MQFCVQANQSIFKEWRWEERMIWGEEDGEERRMSNRVGVRKPSTE